MNFFLDRLQLLSFKSYVFIYLVVLGLCCTRAFSSCSEWGATLPCSAQASHCGGFSLQSTDSRHLGFGRCSTRARWLQWVALGCECFRTCGTWALFLHGIRNLPRQGFELNLCPLHWQADFYPLCHKGSPAIVFYSNYRENTKLSLP